MRKTVHGSRFTVHGSQEGMALVISLLLLLVATIVGITALSTSTTNVMITGNQRLSEINFRSADSGINVIMPIANSTIYDRTLSTTYSSDPDLTIDSSFVNEMSGALPMNNDCPARSSDCSNPSPDLQFSLGTGADATTVSVDMDYLYSGAAAGSAILMFMGYEGSGAGTGSGVLIYYLIDSYADGPAGSQARVYGVYQYVTR